MMLFVGFFFSTWKGNAMTRHSDLTTVAKQLGNMDTDYEPSNEDND